MCSGNLLKGFEFINAGSYMRPWKKVHFWLETHKRCASEFTTTVSGFWYFCMLIFLWHLSSFIIVFQLQYHLRVSLWNLFLQQRYAFQHCLYLPKAGVRVTGRCLWTRSKFFIKISNKLMTTTSLKVSDSLNWNDNQESVLGCC